MPKIQDANAPSREDQLHDLRNMPPHVREALLKISRNLGGQLLVVCMTAMTDQINGSLALAYAAELARSWSTNSNPGSADVVDALIEDVRKLARDDTAEVLARQETTRAERSASDEN